MPGFADSVIETSAAGCQFSPYLVWEITCQSFQMWTAVLNNVIFKEERRFLHIIVCWKALESQQIS